MIRSFSRETKLGSPWGTRRTQLSERRLLGKVNATPAPTFCVGAHLFPQSKSEIKVGIGYVTRLRMSVSYPTATVRSKPANSIIEANSRNEVGFTLKLFQFARPDPLVPQLLIERVQKAIPSTYGAIRPLDDASRTKKTVLGGEMGTPFLCLDDVPF